MNSGTRWLLMGCAAIAAFVLVVAFWPVPTVKYHASPSVDREPLRGRIKETTSPSCPRRDFAFTEADEPEEDTEELVSEGKARIAYEQVFDAFVAKQEKEGWEPACADIARYKKSFDALTDAQKIEQIPHAQNLFTDEAFGFLKAILMDPKEPQEVLESIYYDLLNRPEELKYSVLCEVYEIADHPLHSEIEELNAMLDD